jgi:hypothetical protein
VSMKINRRMCVCVCVLVILISSILMYAYELCIAHSDDDGN